MKVRKTKISTRIFIYLMVGTLVNILVLSVFMYNRSKKIVLSQIRNKVENYAQLAAAAIDPEVFSTVEGDDQDEYEDVYEALALYRDNCDLEYIYALSQSKGGHISYVVDTDKEEPSGFGEEFEADEVTETAFEGIVVSNNEITYDEWGGHITGYAPILLGKKTVGVVGVDIGADDVTAQFNKLLIGTIVIAIIIIAAITLILHLISKKLSHYFDTLNDKVAELADGDLDKKVVFNTGDEMEVIAENINRFIETVKGLVSQVAVSSNENADTLRRMNSDVMALSANMEECSATSETASNYLSDVAKRMDALVNDVKTTDSFVDSEKVHANESAEFAASKRAGAINMIEEINSNIRKALEQANVISKVSDMTEEIEKISLQTRILSLNAQVEAARAGRYGTGFAVVATEISKLSDKTTQTVEEIVVVNNTVQEAMQNLRSYVEKMDRFMTTDVVGDYDEFMQLGIDYGKTTDNLLDKMTELRSRSDEILSMLEMVNSSVHDISLSVADSAGQIENFSGATNNISESMNSLLNCKILSTEKKL